MPNPKSKQISWYLLPSVLLALILLSLATNTKARSINDYQVPPSKNFSVKDGLAQVSVFDIAQDSDGFIWIATQKGADRFNGYDFTNFGQRVPLSDGLSSDLVYAVELEPRSGDMWFGTLNGLNVLRYDTKKFERILLPEEDEQKIYSIYIDHESNVFVGTQNGFYVKPAASNLFQLLSDKTQTIVVEDINRLDDNSVLAATSDGLYQYNKEMNFWKLVLLDGVGVESVLVDSNNQLWAGTIGKGLYRADIVNGQIQNLVYIGSKDGFDDSLINDIKEMKDGSVWIATTRGITIFPDATKPEFLNYFEREKPDSSIIDTHSIVFFENDSGLILVGTNASGFNVVDSNKTMFRRYLIPDNLHHYHIAAQSDDTLWFAVESGIWKRTPDSVLTGPYPSGLGEQTGNKVMSIRYAEDSDTLWVATRLGLGKVTKDSSSVDMVAFENKAIYSIATAPNGVWIGSTSHGLHFYDTRVEEITKSFDTGMVVGLNLVGENQLLVATANGLILLNTATDIIRTITTETPLQQPIAHNVVTWVSKYETGKYFIGLHSHGLMMMELENFESEPKFTQLFPNSELAKSSIGAVIVDSAGNAWISTERGIAKGNLENGSLSYFDENDGTNESGYYIGASAQLSDGSIYFAGDQGVSYFYPQNITKNTAMPPLKITEARTLRLGDNFGAKRVISDFANKDSIVLEPKDIMLAVDFAALEYGSPETIQYAYRLMGFDDRWQYLDAKNRTVTYTNLDPGLYSLELKTTNRNGIWNTDAETLKITVSPPWWQTPWAITLFLLAILLVLYTLFRWRTYALHKNAIQLQKSVDEKTIELKQANARLSLLITLDPLTKVFNRRGFTNALAREFSRYQREGATFSIVLIDVDFFKKINDENGHESGDKVLIEITNLLKEHARSYDILARWGGEEFILLLPGTKLPEAILIANKYREIIAEHVFKVSKLSLNVTLTAGVANISQHSSTEACINHADKLLYEGKNMGRNQVLPML